MRFTLHILFQKCSRRSVIMTSCIVSGVFKTMCEIDITYYPFDEQLCVLVFGAWSYHTAKMNLTNISDIVNLDSYKVTDSLSVYYIVMQIKSCGYVSSNNSSFVIDFS